MVPAELPSGDAGDLPLAVDLDGTLIRSDTLVENWLSALRTAPLTALAAPFYLLRGKAFMKARLAAVADIDAARLPYNEDFLGYLKAEKARGRQLILATASHIDTARKIADHLGLFDDVIGTDAASNLRGPAKAAMLRARFGEQGFAYAGNDRHDLVVWRDAGGAVLVDLPPGLSKAVDAPVERTFPPASGQWRELIRGMRLYQWVKNILVFLPLVTANALGDTAAVLIATATFLIFGLVASGVYLLNDLTDLEADRAHPEKRLRPFASGAVPLTRGLIFGPLLILAGLLGAWFLSPMLAAVVLVYAVVTTLYSLVLKTLPLVDVFVLAFLYTLRVIAGGVATGYLPTIWLLSFSSFFFLSLAFAKRYVEVSGAAEKGEMKRRGYLTSEDVLLLVMGAASAFSAAIVLAIYVESSVAEATYSRPLAIWIFVPLCLFWQCRIWLAAVRDQVSHDPILFASRDKVSWAVILSAVGIYLIAA